MFSVSGGLLYYNGAVFARLVQPNQSKCVSTSEQEAAIHALNGDEYQQYKLEPLD
jgi:hypothetical protein